MNWSFANLVSAFFNFFRRALSKCDQLCITRGSGPVLRPNIQGLSLILGPYIKLAHYFSAFLTPKSMQGYSMTQ